MPDSSLIGRLQSMRQFYNSGQTRPYRFRKQQLQKLRSTILSHEKDLHDALHNDLKKNAEESWITETGFLVSEINFALKNLSQWMQPERVKTNLVNFPSSSYIMREPLGVVLIIGPWRFFG